MGGILYALIFASATYLPASVADWSLPETRSVLVFAPIFIFWVVRPWFMGVWVADDLVTLRGWFRTTRVAASRIEGVTVVRYFGLWSYGSIGWIPFVGSIGVVKIRETGGRARDYSGTVGRARTVRDVARRIRKGCGITHTRYDYDPQE